MGLIGWLKGRLAKGAPADADPVQAYDRRLDTLRARSAELRRSAATLLAARGELDRAIAAAQEAERQAKERLEEAAGRHDVAAVLEADRERARQRGRALAEERERLVSEAKGLAEAVAGVEAEAEGLRREREAARARWTASRTVADSAGKALAESAGELTALDRARDEIERARALAEICREDLERERKKREGGER